MTKKDGYDFLANYKIFWLVTYTNFMAIHRTLSAVLIRLLKSLFSHAHFKVLALLITLASSSAVATNQSVELLFCYENKEFTPHFFGNSTLVPSKNPGVVVDILRALDIEETRVIIKFIRQPWARCLKDLESGNVSAVVGSYSIKRAIYGAYPRKENKIDLTRAFSNLSTCLLHQKTEKVRWDGEKLTFKSPITIAIPRGYKIIRKLEDMGFTAYITDSLDQAHKLLFFGRVAASISDCTFKNYPATITMNNTPIRNHYGHLILNRSFYNKNRLLSESLWDKLQKIDKQSYYQNYLKEPIPFSSQNEVYIR